MHQEYAGAAESGVETPDAWRAFFPHAKALLRQIAALLMETNQEWMSRLYLRMEDQPEVDAAEATAAAA